MITKIISFSFIALTLFSCKVTKDTTAPTPQLPAHFRNATVTDTPGIADIHWKEFFTDASLQTLIDSAISNNYDMQVAVKNIEAAQLAYGQVKWNYLPQAALSISAGSTRPSDNSLNGKTASQFLGKTHVEDFSTNVALSWEADIWGKIKNQKSGALAQYLQTTEARKAIQTNIVAAVAQGYYNLLMLDAQVAIAKRNLTLNDSTLNIIKLQYHAGQVSLLAVQQAEAQQLAAALLIPQFEQDRLLQENALSILTGVLPGVISTNNKLGDFPIQENLSAGIPAAMVQRRPDVRSRELQLAIANAKVGIAKANMYPSLRITALAGINSFKASNWFNIPASLFGAVAGSITQPLLQGRQLKTNFEIAQVERERSVLEFRQSVLVAVGEVSDALARIGQLKLQEEIATQRTSTLRLATNNAGLLFQNGMATYLEVIIAQSNVLQSELELAVVKRAELGAIAELYRSLGGGQ